MTVGVLARLEEWLLAWMEAARRRRIAAISGVTLLTAGCLGYAAAFLGVNSDTSAMIDPSTPYRQAALEFDAAFPAFDEQVLVLVRADTPDAAEIVTAELAEALLARPDIAREVFAPSGHPFFQRNGLLYLDEAELARVLGDLNQAAPLLARLNADPSADSLFHALALGLDAGDPGEVSQRDAVYAAVADTIEARLAGAPQPLSWRLLFADIGEAETYQRLINVIPELDYSRLAPARPVVEAVRAEAARIAQETGLEADVRVTGDLVLRADELASVADGIARALLISLVLVFILLRAALRSTPMALTALGVVLATVAAAAALAAALFGALNLVSVAFVVLLVGLGVDFSIHLALHLEALRSAGAPLDQALRRTARDIGGALALTAPTTALAFFAFTPTRFDGIAQLGVVAGLGVLAASAFAVTLVPAVSALLPPPRVAASPGLPRLPGGSRTRRGFALAVAAATAASLFLLPRVAFDADPMSLRDPHSPSVRAFNLLFDDQDTVPYRLSVLTPSLAAAEAAAARLEALPPVDAAITLASFIPEDQAAKLDLIEFSTLGLSYALAEDAPARLESGDGAAALAERLAEEGEGPAAARLARALAGYRAALAEEPGLAAALTADLLAYWPWELAHLRRQLAPEFVSAETLPDDVRNRFVSHDGRHRVEIRPAGDARDAVARRAFIDSVLQVAPGASGGARSVTEAGDIISRAMAQATLLAFGGAALILGLALRSVREPVFMLIPLAMAAILTAATGVLIDRPFNFANVIVLPLLIGIGVDSGIHLALRSRRLERASDVYATTTPRAVTFSALTTIASFGSLAFSPHRGTASMGLLLTIAIAFTLICTVVVLPTLVEAWQRIAGRGPATGDKA